MFYLFIWLCRVFTAAQTFSLVMESSDYSLIVVPTPLNAVASLVAEQEGL